MNFDIKYHLQQSCEELRKAKAFLLLYMNENEADGNIVANDMLQQIEDINLILKNFQDKFE